MANLSAWVQASRPLAQVNIALPLLFGQALAFAQTGALSIEVLVLVHLFGVLDQLFIVFANDAADWRSDLANTTFNRYSGGSRVIAEGKLTPMQLAVASLGALLAMALVCAYIAFTELRPFMVVACAFAAFLLWAYSFPPIQLSYRGRGEILQGVGVGMLLPFIGYYAQSGALIATPIRALLPAFLLGYAGNLTTALPDTPSDRKTGKRTYPVRHGQWRARRDSLLVIALAAASTPVVLPHLSAAALAALISLPLVPLGLNVRNLPDADAANRQRCERFVLLNGVAIAAAFTGWTVALL